MTAAPEAVGQALALLDQLDPEGVIVVCAGALGIVLCLEHGLDAGQEAMVEQAHRRLDQVAHELGGGS